MCKKLIKTAIYMIFAAIFAVFCPNCKQTAYAVVATGESELAINARASFLLDAYSGTELYASNADEKLPIASMTKLATLAVIFGEVERGALDLDTKITISQNAADTEGSSAFLDAGSSYKVADLIKTIVVVSANDSCVALAEHIAGTEELFAKKMNDTAKALGAKNTNFENSTGLPVSGHYSSARDMAKIYLAIADNPTYKKFSKIWMEDFIHPSGRKTGLVNTNRLIKTYEGCDSGKTGHTSEAKYCLTASATRAGMRLVGVVIGADSSKERFDSMKTLFNYGFANYQNQTLVSAEIPLAIAKINRAKTSQIEAYANGDYVVLTHKGEESKYKTHIVMNENLSAPIAVGQKLGTIYILDQNNMVVDEVDLVARENIDRISFGDILNNIYKAWN